MAARDTDVKIAKQVQPKQTSATPATVVSTARGLLRYEPNRALVQRQLLPANGIMEVMANIPYRILLTNVSSQHVHVPKHMKIGQLYKQLTTIVKLDQLFTTPMENTTLVAAVSIIQGPTENTSSSKRGEIKHQMTRVTLLVYRINMPHTVTTSFTCPNLSSRYEMGI